MIAVLGVALMIVGAIVGIIGICLWLALLPGE
jgi:hypothetical protein